jgi:hypothetical protein
VIYGLRGARARVRTRARDRGVQIIDDLLGGGWVTNDVQHLTTIETLDLGGMSCNWS